MSLNGDDWAVTVDGRQPLDSVMTGEVNAPGPVITLSARVQGERGDVTLVQDATIPSMLARAMPRGIGMLLQGAGGRSHPLRWLEHSAPWLVMGHDGARGSAGLDSERHLRMTWPDVMDDPSVETRDRILAELADVQRARMIRPPRAWGHRSARAAITVHALGGARMADSPRDGVVDEFGRVFRPDRGVHPGLYVLDGSVCSSALGANPSLGIAARAERGIAEVMATDLGLPAGEAAVLGRM
jgi:cholesterol oxidase